MDKNLIKYLNRGSNIYIGELKITRDIAPNGNEYIRICSPDDDKEIYQHWYNPDAKKKNNEKPKHTGGKKPYLMLMIEEIEKLRKNDEVKNVEELIGYVACLGKYIEWNTGRLLHKKKKKPLKYSDLQKIYGCSKPKLNKMIGIMKEHELLYYTDSGYFISPRLIKKGKMQKKGDDRECPVEK